MDQNQQVQIQDTSRQWQVSHRWETADFNAALLDWAVPRPGVLTSWNTVSVLFDLYAF